MYVIVFPQMELQQHLKLTLVKRIYFADFPSYMKFNETGAMLKVYMTNNTNTHGKCLYLFPVFSFYSLQKQSTGGVT